MQQKPETKSTHSYNNNHLAAISCFSFNGLKLFVGQQKVHLACKKVPLSPKFLTHNCRKKRNWKWLTWIMVSKMVYLYLLVTAQFPLWKLL